MFECWFLSCVTINTTNKRVPAIFESILDDKYMCSVQGQIVGTKRNFSRGFSRIQTESRLEPLPVIQKRKKNLFW